MLSIVLSFVYLTLEFNVASVVKCMSDINFAYYHYYYYYQDILHKSILTKRHCIRVLYSDWSVCIKFEYSISYKYVQQFLLSFTSLRLSITSPINHFAYQSHRLSITRLSITRLSITSPINHFAYQSLAYQSLAYQSLRLSITSPISLAHNVHHFGIHWLPEGE